MDLFFEITIIVLSPLALVGVLFLIVTIKAPALLNVLPWYDPGGATLSVSSGEALDALVSAVQEAGLGPTFGLETEWGRRAFLACGAHLAELGTSHVEHIGDIVGAVTFVCDNPAEKAEIIASILQQRGFEVMVTIPALPDMQKGDFVFVETNAMKNQNGLTFRKHKKYLVGKPHRWKV